ncbi:MAG: hypothetical protein ACO3QC_01310 [Phycisphaerales bacterium]
MSSSKSTNSIRYCRNCRHALDLAASRACQEGSHGFDPADPRSTLSTPHGSIATAAERVSRVSVPLLIAGGVASIFANASGWILHLWLGSCAFAPVLALVLLAASLPTARIPIRRRVVIVALAAILVSVPLTDWPLRVMFEAHRGAMDRQVELERARSSAPRGAIVVGLMRFMDVRWRPELHAVGFQLSGGAGGGVFLVHRDADANFVWHNTNWEKDLGDGWWFVYQD